jgi:VanZ family protein
MAAGRPSIIFSEKALDLTKAIIISTIISGTIEMLQVYLPLRSPSFEDIPCNAGGSFAGALFGLLEAKAARRQIAL